MLHLNWSLVARVAEFTVYYLLPRVQPLLVDVSEEFPAGHTLLFRASLPALLPGVTKMGGWFPDRRGEGGGLDVSACLLSRNYPALRVCRDNGCT